MSDHRDRFDLEQFATDGEIPDALRKLLAEGALPAEIRLDARGRWLYQQAPVAHPRVVSLFHRSLDRTSQGNWLLRVGRYAYPVVVEDTGRFVVRLKRVAGRWLLRLSDGSSEPFDPAAVQTDSRTFFGTMVHGNQLARFIGPAMLTLAELLEARDEQVGVAVDSGWWPLQRRQ